LGKSTFAASDKVDVARTPDAYDKKRNAVSMSNKFSSAIDLCGNLFLGKSNDSVDFHGLFEMGRMMGLEPTAF
jgi:hypothetical protein